MWYRRHLEGRSGRLGSILRCGASVEPMKERSREPDEQESRAAVAVTVAWMLACTSTAVGMFVVLAFRFLMMAFLVAAGRDHPLGRIAGVLLLVVVVSV